MIQSIYIKNFKAFARETIPIEDHNILVGENDSGKTSVLQALDIFFNQEKVDKNFVRELGATVEIGVLVNGRFFKKVYRGAAYKESPDDFIGDSSIIERFRYIYISIESYDPKSLISQLAIAKTIENTSSDLIQDLKSISQNSISEVLNSVDRELLIVNNVGTQLTGLEAFKYDASLKFNVQSDGIPIEARGSGFQKNLMYALLMGNTFENVIVGIDEIENSLSITNCSSLIHGIQNRIGQTLITTHSRKVLEVCGGSRIIPFFGLLTTRTLAILLTALDNTYNKKFLLVEGKFDIPWLERCIFLLNRVEEFIIIPSGGQNNADTIKGQLEAEGKTCFIIRDGDTEHIYSLTKDCIELYVPLHALNSIFQLTLTSIPTNKDDFFSITVVDNVRNQDTVKRILSSKVNEFLLIDNVLVQEVANLLRQ